MSPQEIKFLCRFLKLHNAYFPYFSSISKVKYNSIKKIVRLYLSNKDIYASITTAFLWRQTSQGNLFWYDINNKLMNLLKLGDAK